jgi:hypothetical protein
MPWPERGSGEAVEAADEEVDQVRRGDAGQLGHVDVAMRRSSASRDQDQADFPFEVIAVGLVGVA